MWATLLRAAALADVERVPRLTAEAEAITRSITSPCLKAEALIGLAIGHAAASDLDRAEILARSIPSARQRSSAFAALAETAAVTEDGRAAIFAASARSIASRQRAIALAAVVDLV